MTLPRSASSGDDPADVVRRGESSPRRSPASAASSPAARGADARDPRETRAAHACARWPRPRRARPGGRRRWSGVHVRAPERRSVDVLEDDLLDHLRTRHEHQRVGAGEDDEVGDGRRIHRAPGARPEDDGDLRHPTRQANVAAEDLSVSGERRDALLDAGASRVEQPDDRRADALREVHTLADLERVRLAERPAHEAPVLRERDDDLPVHATRRDADAVAVEALPVHAPVPGLVVRERVELFVLTLVEEQREPAARRRDLLHSAARALLDRAGRDATGDLVHSTCDSLMPAALTMRTSSVGEWSAPGSRAISMRARRFSPATSVRRPSRGPTRRDRDFAPRRQSPGEGRAETGWRRLDPVIETDARGIP